MPSPKTRRYSVEIKDPDNKSVLFTAVGHFSGPVPGLKINQSRYPARIILVGDDLGF